MINDRLAHMALDPETGGDPPGIRLRAVKSLEAGARAQRAQCGRSAGSGRARAVRAWAVRGRGRGRVRVF